MIKMIRFVKKPLYVKGIQVTAENMAEVAKLSGGEVRTALNPRTKEYDEYIFINVLNARHPRQTMAFLGDWVLQFRDHYKIYSKKAFPDSFDPAPEEDPLSSAALEKKLYAEIFKDEFDNAMTNNHNPNSIRS